VCRQQYFHRFTGPRVVLHEQNVVRVRPRRGGGHGGDCIAFGASAVTILAILGEVPELRGTGTAAGHLAVMIYVFFLSQVILRDRLLDLYETNADQPSLLYHGVTAPHGHWIELKLVGTKSNRDAVGARVTLRAGSNTWIREVNGGNGYAGQSSKRVHVGLGAAAKIDSLVVRWPSGRTEGFTVPIDKISTLKEGEGSAK